MTFGLRPPLPQDQDALAVLASQPLVAHGLGILRGSGVAWARERLETRDPNCYAMVAVVEADVIGWVRIVRQLDRKSHAAMLEIAVRTDFQGRGVGRALLQEILDLADNSLGLRRIELEVFEDNQKARSLYESEGFELEGTRREAVLSNGAFMDGHILARVRG